jgi:hypothetical protein
MEKGRERRPRFDIACINAGVGVGGLFAGTDLDAELNIIELNCSEKRESSAKEVAEQASRLCSQGSNMCTPLPLKLRSKEW